MGLDNINENNKNLQCRININECNKLINNSTDNGSSKLFTIAEIDSGLLLCGASMITDNALTKLGITCVVSVCPELPPVPLPNNITHHYLINVRDTMDSDLRPHFDDISDTIHKVKEEGGRTLVHCVAGVSRSASLCIAYLVKCRNMSLNEAYWHVHSRRQCIRPNNSFFEQLIEFEEKLTGVKTVKMVYNSGAKGVIPDVYESIYYNTTNYNERFIGTK